MRGEDGKCLNRSDRSASFQLSASPWPKNFRFSGDRLTEDGRGFSCGNSVISGVRKGTEEGSSSRLLEHVLSASRFTASSSRLNGSSPWNADDPPPPPPPIERARNRSREKSEWKNRHSSAGTRSMAWANLSGTNDWSTIRAFYRRDAKRFVEF